MCIIFLHVDPKCQQTDYKLIIASNRDEIFQRPSKEAGFMHDNEQVLCGIDLEKGVEGGTWLGVTKTGKFGFVTNYFTPVSHELVEESGLSRGSIVKDYLYSNLSISEYIEKCLVDKNFRPFTFIGGQFLSSGNDIDMFYYSNFDKTSPYKLQPGTYTLACTSLGRQWKKVQLGSDIFASLKSSRQTPNELTDSLIKDLLSNTTDLYPDPMIIEQNGSKHDENFLKSYCSIMVSGLPGYGTRAQTVVLVDKDNRLYFTEKSMTDHKGAELCWKRKSFDFPLIL